MAWNNRTFQKFKDQFGDRINSISFNNGKYLLIGYESGIQLKDIEPVTLEGVDCLKIHHKQQSGGIVLEWDDYMTTEFIEGVDVMSEQHKDYRLDPFILK